MTLPLFKWGVSKERSNKKNTPLNSINPKDPPMEGCECAPVFRFEVYAFGSPNRHWIEGVFGYLGNRNCGFGRKEKGPGTARRFDS